MKTKSVLAHYDGADNLAKALHIDRSAISHWGETVTWLRQFQIQVLTNGKFKASLVPPKKSA